MLKCLLILASTASASAVQCSSNIYGNLELYVGQYPVDIAVVDLDADGDHDIVAPTGYWLTICLQQDDQSFIMTQDKEMKTAGVAAADYDGDGIIDLAMTQTSTDEVYIVFGVGDGTFEPPSSIATGVLPTRIRAADVNGDGAMDVCLICEASGWAECLVNDGTGTFDRVIVPTADSPVGLDIADIDLDGHEDLVIAARGFWEPKCACHVGSRLVVHHGLGDGTFERESVIVDNERPRDVDVDDIDSDGDEDIVFAASDGVHVLLNDAGFGERFVLQTPKVATSVDLIDLDGDGALDVAALGEIEFEGVAWLFRGLGDGTFDPVAHVWVGDDPRRVATGHFNDDDVPELVVANAVSYSVSVLEGLGGAEFASDTVFIFEQDLGPMDVGDVDADGDADIVASHDDIEVVFFENDGTGALQQHRLSGVRLEPRTLALADLTGDGSLEIVAGYSSPRTLEVYRRVGSMYELMQLLELESNPQHVLTVDLNGDRSLDVALVQSNDSLLAFDNDGNGLLAPAGDLELLNFQTLDLAAGDLDDDGFPELFVPDRDDDVVYVMDNDGHGTFSHAFALEAGNTPSAVATGDLDDDGDVDVVIANGIDDRVHVRENIDGTLQEPLILYADRAGPRHLVLADVNGDGRPDLVTGNSAHRDLSVFLNLGDMNFDEDDQRRFGSIGVATLRSADLNADGTPDMVASGDHALSVLLSRCEATCIADVNGDGELSVLDFVAFQLLWVDQDPAADCNGDEAYSILDFVCYQLLYQAGCP